MKKRVLLLSGIVVVTLGMTACSSTTKVPKSEAWNEAETQNVEQESKTQIMTQMSDMEESSSAVDEESNELLNQFITGEVKAFYVDSEDGTGNEFSLEDLNKNAIEWDSPGFAYNIDHFADFDNDGEDELYLNGPYGGMILDTADDKVVVFATGEKAAYELKYITFENAVWIIHREVSHGGRQMRHFTKYEGTKIVDEFDFSAEYWDNESGSYDENSDFTFRGSKITMQEYEQLLIKLFPEEVYYYLMPTGAISLSEDNKIAVKTGFVEYTEEGNIMMGLFDKQEGLSYELAQDADIFLFYPVDDSNGAYVISSELLELLHNNDHIDCYYRVNEEGKIDWIRGLFYS